MNSPLGDESHYTRDSEFCCGFEYLQFLKHHFIGHASKVTPSGRAQSAVLIVLSHGLMLCSNRGGLHRFISFVSLSAVRQFPRGRLLFEVRGEHSLLISTPNAAAAVGIISSLVRGSCGTEADFCVCESMPSGRTLNLRPLPGFVSRIPAFFADAVRRAALSSAREEAAVQLAALKEEEIGISSTSLGGSTVLPQSVGREKEVAAGGPSADVLQAKEPAEDASLRGPSDLTILVAIGPSEIATFPATVSLWEYMKFVANNLPGATQEPVLSVRCVSDTEFVIPRINHSLFQQTMVQYAECMPHTVTVREDTACNGINLDSEIYWKAPLPHDS